MLDDEAHEVRRGDERIDLSATEYRVLRYLMLNAGRVLSKAQILEHVWQYDFDGESTVVETYISYLRKKVDQYEPAVDPHGPRVRLRDAAGTRTREPSGSARSRRPGTDRSRPRRVGVRDEFRACVRTCCSGSTTD